MSVCEQDLYWMKKALLLAKQAESQDEVPVGAIVVHEGKLIGSGHNQPIGLCNPTAHAEVLALQEAALRQNNYRLINCELYVTLEPCMMCVGAIVHSRVKRLIFAAFEPKAGAVVSQNKLLDCNHLNHKVEITTGVLEAESASLLSHFFSRRRQEKRIKNH